MKIWIEDVNGRLINLDNVECIEFLYQVEAVFSGEQSVILFDGKDVNACQTYMEQLKKELAAFGKLVKVVLSE